MFLGEFTNLERVLEAAFPIRFAAHPAPGKTAENFASHWIYALVEACIARCAIRSEPFEAASPAIDETIAELVSCLARTKSELVCCRVVENLTTSDRSPVSIWGLEIQPEVDGRRRIPELIPGGASAFNRDPPFAFDPPESLIVHQGSGHDPYAVSSNLSARISRFLLLVRLLYATTAWTAYEVTGPSTHLHPIGPRLTVSRLHQGLVRRVLTVVPQYESQIAGLDTHLKTVQRHDSQMMFTSFGLAISRFTRSYETVDWDAQILDLSTALEAAISGTDKTDVILRLKTRAAALLADDTDSAELIFADIGHLYELRSALIHGGSFGRSKFERRVHTISSVPHDAPLGVAVEHMVDRLRDIVRRLILARICLAVENVWQLGRDEGVDARLADDTIRSTWQGIWRHALLDIGAGEAANRASPADDSIGGIS